MYKKTYFIFFGLFLIEKGETCNKYVLGKPGHRSNCVPVESISLQIWYENSFYIHWVTHGKSVITFICVQYTTYDAKTPRKRSKFICPFSRNRRVFNWKHQQLWKRTIWEAYLKCLLLTFSLSVIALSTVRFTIKNFWFQLHS